MARKLADADGLRRHDRQMLGRGASLGFRLHEPPDAECYFCDGVDVVDSLEHIVPKWLHKPLELNDKTFEPVYTNQGLDVHQRPSIPASQLVSAGICQSCNSGWMSRLESRFAPFIRDGREVTSDIVARWFIKTAFVLNVTQNTRLLVPRDVRLALAAGNISERVSVFLHQSAPPDQIRFNWVQNPMLPPLEYPSEAEAAALESIKLLWSCTINLDGLVVTVIVNPPGDSFVSSWERLGKTLVILGKVRPMAARDSLPPLSFWGNGNCLVPARLGWADLQGVTMPFPGFRGFADVMAFNRVVASVGTPHRVSN